MAAVADHKGIRPEKLTVRIGRTTQDGSPWRTSFAVHLDLGGGLTPRQRTILLGSARQCEVHKLLSGEIRFEYSSEQPMAPMLAREPEAAPTRDTT